MVPFDPAAGRTSSLITAFRLLRERWWIVAICFVLAVALAVALDSRRVDQYEATATLLFGSNATNATGVVNAGASSVSNDPQRDQGTTLLLVTSSSVAERARRALATQQPSDSLAGQVTASAQPDANLVDVTATDPDPRRAARLANVFADQYKLFRRDSERDGLAQGIADLRRQLATLAPDATTERQAITTALSQLTTTQAASTGGVQVVDRATVPSTPSSPRPKRDAVLGGLLGLAFGAVLAFALDVFDRRLKTVTDFERAYGITATASVPLGRSLRHASDDVEAIEPFRILRSGLDLIGARGLVDSVLVTSAVMGEGKSTTAIGLARAIAMSGQSVVLVELDLRRPTLHEYFHLGEDRRGLTSALINHVPLDELIRQPVPELPTLSVLAAGGIPQRSAELLDSAEMDELFKELRSRFDTVVMDAPPLLPVADTRGLLDLPSVAACLIVGRAFVTTRDQASRARAILAHHGARQLGLVVNGLHSAQARYEYGSGYEASAETTEVFASEPVPAGRSTT